MTKLSVSSFSILSLLLIITIGLFTATEAAKEPKTGTYFRDRFKGRQLMKLGLRSKGLLHYYAVGQYGQRTFLLEITSDVSTKEITKGLRKELQSRCQDIETVLEFEELILAGLPSNGVPKGTTIFFSCLSRRLSVEINGKSIGSIRSDSLAKAFQGIYTDTNKVE